MCARVTRAHTFGLLKAACGVVLFALVGLAVGRSWNDVSTAISMIEPFELLIAEALILAGLGASVLTWRQGVAEVGMPVRLDAAARIYLLGQLAKYLPGSVWALAAQSELARSAGVPRSRGVAASFMAIGINVVTGLAIGVALVPRVTEAGMKLTGVLALILAVCACVLSPPVLTRLVDLGLRTVRRPALDRSVTWTGVGIATAWSVTSWICYGLSVWVLAVGMGAPASEALLLCVAGVSLAMTVGFMVVVTPSGIGVREAVIVGALSPVLDASDALAVALVARLLFTLADLIAAAVVAPVRIRQAEVR
jgi:hypothetical protein